MSIFYIVFAEILHLHQRVNQRLITTTTTGIVAEAKTTKRTNTAKTTAKTTATTTTSTVETVAQEVLVLDRLL